MTLAMRLEEPIDWEIDLRSLTALPDGLVLPQTIGGSLDLRSLTALPDGLREKFTVLDN